MYSFIRRIKLYIRVARSPVFSGRSRISAPISHLPDRSQNIPYLTQRSLASEINVLETFCSLLIVHSTIFVTLTLYLISRSVLVLGTNILYDIADSIKTKFRQILLTRQNFSSFWKNVSRTTSRDLSYPFKVANATGAADICNLWYNHYKTLFSSVGYESHTMECCFQCCEVPVPHSQL